VNSADANLVMIVWVLSGASEVSRIFISDGNYPRISAMRIVTAVTRPRMSASPG